MNKNILKTKKKLTIIFILIVSLVIIILGLSFFSIKYYKEITFETNFLNKLGDKIQEGKVNKENILKLSYLEGGPIKKREIIQKISNTTNNINLGGPINFIILKGEEIVSYNIKYDLEREFINTILNEKTFNESFQEDGFLFTKVKVGDNTFLLFKKLRYSLLDYSSDVFLFIFVTFIFSALFFLIGKKFIDETFLPVEENIKDMNDFIHNAGHELKTPISIIDSNIQTMLSIKEYEEFMLYEIKDETKKLNGLINSLIKLSDIGEFNIVSEKINLKNIVNEIIESNKLKISLKEIKIKISIKKDVFVKTNRDYFYILLSNLIGNAIKYNKSGGEISISYKNGELIIKDNGIGIPQDSMKKIFDRFYKVDFSRNSEGYGIGLSLVKKIVDIFSWKILVESTQGKGTTFTLKIKL